MTRRNIAWRTLGFGLYAQGCACGIKARDAAERGYSGISSLLVIAGLVIAILGIVLMVQGRKVARLLRIERTPHRELPYALGRGRAGRRPPP